jgi:uncharacterized protein (DUF4415 family)
MKDEPTGNDLAFEGKTDWDRVRNMSNADAHAALASDADVKPTDADFWESAEVVLPRSKEVVTIRLDADVLEWFRQERGYQTRINAILQAYMKAHVKEHKT